MKNNKKDLPKTRNRIKIVHERFKKRVMFATDKDEKAIMGTLDRLQKLMDHPMNLDGDPLTDDLGNPISRKNFWRLASTEDVHDLLDPDAIDQIDSLEELADIIYLAKFEPAILLMIYENEAFLWKVCQVRDEDGNTLLHWIAAADMPRKALHGLIKALRDLGGREELNEAQLLAIEDCLLSENDRSVKLHEIAYALKDEGLATELMRSSVSVREPNRVGLNFVDQAAATKEGETYLGRLKNIAEDEKITAIPAADFTITAEDRAKAQKRSEIDKLLDDFLHGERKDFIKTLNDAVRSDAPEKSIFFEFSPEETLKRKGFFKFGRSDRDGRDWLYHIIEHGDLEILDPCIRLIEAYAAAVSKHYILNKPGQDPDMVQKQLLRVYVKQEAAEGMSAIIYAMRCGKSLALRRLLTLGLFDQNSIDAAPDKEKKKEMMSRNIRFLIGQRPKENLYVQAALAGQGETTAEQEQAVTNVMKILEQLFEPLSDAQGAALYKMKYAIGKGSHEREISFKDYIQDHPQIISRVKEAFALYESMYMID